MKHKKKEECASLVCEHITQTRASAMKKGKKPKANSASSMRQILQKRSEKDSKKYASGSNSGQRQN